MSRDALAKALYHSLFSWLVARLSRSLHPPGDLDLYNHVGVLDIFGFEDFLDENYFEQLCINYANERLQKNFNTHVFEEELKLYKAENVPEDLLRRIAVDSPNNKRTCDLLKKMTEILNECSNRNPMPDLRECFISGKLDESFGYSSDEGKSAAPFELSSFREFFVINHYAGRVEYRYEDMLARNNDELKLSLRRAAQASKSRFVSQLLGDRGRDSSLSASKKRQKKKKQPQQRGKKNSSIISSFSNSLKKLFAKLSNAQLHYVRCLKPNSLKRAGLFQTSKVLEQMKCAGLFDAVKIRKNGFPFRVPIAKFLRNYGSVVAVSTDEQEEKHGNKATTALKTGGENEGGSSRQKHDWEEEEEEKEKHISRAKMLIQKIGAAAVQGKQKQWSILDVKQGHVFVGTTSVLMHTEYWNALNALRQEKMKERFVEAIESRAIPKLEAVVRKAMELDMHFAEAVSARRMLEFLRREEYCILTEIPNLLKLVDVNFFVSERAGMKDALTVSMAPISSYLHANTLESYFATGGKKLQAAWQVLKSHETTLRGFGEFEKRVSKVVNRRQETQITSMATLGAELDDIIQTAGNLPPRLQEKIADNIEAAKRLRAYLEKCRELITKLQDGSEKAYDLIDDVVETPEDLEAILIATDALTAVEDMLNGLAREPFAQMVSLRELDKAIVAITRENGYMKMKIHCIRNINTLLQEVKRLSSSDNRYFESMSDETLRRVLEVKVDIEEMRGAGKLERGVNACAVKAVRRWAREWISHSATASMSESAEDGDDDIPANIRHLQGFKAWLLNLNLPKDFGIAEVVQDADAKIGELTKHCRRVIVGKKKKKKKLGGAGKRRGTVTVIGGEEKHGGVKKLETDDNKGDDDLYVPSPRRGKNKTIVVPLTRTSSQIFGEQKSALHNDRRHRLQDQVRWEPIIV